LGLRASTPARAAAARPAARTTPLLTAGDALGLFVPGSLLEVRGLDKPEWQLLQLLLYHPVEAAPVASELNLDWFVDERVRELVDCLQALYLEEGVPSPAALRERAPESLRDMLDALEPDEDADADRVRRRLADFRDGIELRHLRREMEAVKIGGSLAQVIPLQQRVKALESKRVSGTI
jgi:hypothetical protein